MNAVALQPVASEQSAKPTRWVPRILTGGSLYAIIVYLATQWTPVFLGVITLFALGLLAELFYLQQAIRRPNWYHRVFTGVTGLLASLTPISFGYLCRTDPVLAVLAINVAGGTDLGSLLVGKALGGRWVPRLPASVNPGKSYEGLVGGLLIGWLIAGITWVGIQVADAVPNLGLTFTLAAAIPGCLIAHLGDLSGSWYKRQAQVADSCESLPWLRVIARSGHGGFLDRIGSHIWTANLLAGLIWLVGVR